MKTKTTSNTAFDQQISYIDFIDQIMRKIEIIDFDNFDQIIVKSLREISNFLQLENIIILHKNIQSQEILLYSSAWIHSDTKYHDSKFNLKFLPYLTNLFRTNGITKISSLGDLPPEANLDREYLKNSNIASLLMLKSSNNINISGIFAYTLHQREWDDKTVNLLKYFEKLLIFAIDKNIQIKSIHDSKLKFQTISNFTYNLEKWILPDGKLEYISPSCERITGYSQNEFYNQPGLMKKIVYKNDLAEWKLKREILIASKEIQEFEYRIIKKDNEIRWVRQVGQQVINDSGEFMGWRLSIYDITDRKLFESNLIEANDKIKELNGRLEIEIITLKENSEDYSIPGIISIDPVMKKILDKVKQVAHTNSPVLILGETGTGKELIARAIHNLSVHKNKPLVTVNCAAIPSALIESELFGREKGAYTGALSRQIGRFEAANKSSIFLDEIGDLPLETQSKLLRVLQFGEFQMLGSPNTHFVDTRIIAATNRNLSEAIKAGQFREDLFYRINVFPIFLPPLRERKIDIPTLTWEFVKEFSQKMGKRITEISKANMDKLVAYNWPGNLRELRNVIEYAMIISKGKSLNVEFHNSFDDKSIYGITLEEVERNHISRTLEKVNWKIRGKNGAADILGLNESTLRFRMKKLGIAKVNY